MKTIESVRIKASINKVFDYISAPEKQKLWMDGLVHTEYTNQWNDNNPIGSQFKQHLIKGHKKTTYEFQGEILDYKKPNVYAIRISGNDFMADIRYHLEETNGLTQLNSETVMEFRGSLFARFIGRMAAHHNKQDMKKLIMLVEKA
jgi:uncharacterized protein YndB with AHSA1/START domain